uniref:Uncharacterized protein n=1 Tax=Eutreptiella gymnastica TaxID=73025 RepID=A0A6T2EXI0_9EUGL
MKLSRQNTMQLHETPTYIGAIGGQWWQWYFALHLIFFKFNVWKQGCGGFNTWFHTGICRLEGSPSSCSVFRCMEGTPSKHPTAAASSQATRSSGGNQGSHMPNY